MIRRRAGSALFLLALSSIVGLLVDIKLSSQIHDTPSPPTFDGLEPPSLSSNNQQLSIKNESNIENDAPQHGSNDDFKNTSNSVNTNNYGGGTAFCLLIKDDNDILSEWIAYHYHVLKMRRLIVAVDPTSKTSPLEVLEPYERNFDLNFDVWNDRDFMPESFQPNDPSKFDISTIQLRHDPFKFVQFRGKRLKEKSNVYKETIVSTIYHNETYIREHQEEVRQQLLNIKYHRFRQVTFVSNCFRTIKQELEEHLSSNSTNPISWVVHIDTDEFIVPSPWIGEYIHNDPHQGSNKMVHRIAGKRFQRSKMRAMLPEIPLDGSLWSFFHQYFPKASTSESALCITIQRSLFGSKEDDTSEATTVVASGNTSNNVTTVWSHKKFESLRWKYHGDFEKLRLPKNMINVAKLEWNDAIFVDNRIDDYHYVHPRCENKVRKLHSKELIDRPFAIYHYLGSRERYFARGDPRRTNESYDKDNGAANLAFGDHSKDEETNTTKRWWIGKWFDSFVDTHGSERVYSALGEHYATRKNRDGHTDT